VNVVYDSVAKNDLRQEPELPRAARDAGLFGSPADPCLCSRYSRLAKNSLYLTRPGLGQYTATREKLLQRAADVFGWIQAGS